MAELPRGTVTFLFTDIEGSTRLLAETGESYAGMLAEHRRLLRTAFARYDGTEIDTQGDAFFVAFRRASDAVAAAAEAQVSLDGGPVSVRMGIHTGEPVLTAEGYVGMDVHRAARIAGAAHGGQVLLSQATRDLVVVDARDLGEHRLKDLSAPMHLYQLGDRSFPRLRALYETNLPVPTTAFLGRTRELAEVGGLLARPEVRLLTLTGPGGTGKTRLGVQAAAAATENYADGIWWVSLAAVGDADLVESTIAQVFSHPAVLEEELRGKRLLLVLDNFEHLVEAGEVVARILAACPQVDALVTSREPLHLSAEWEYYVEPLSAVDAVELFTARAAAIHPTGEPNGVAETICARLDFLPLAVELAAARTKVMPLEEINRRLEEHLHVLGSGPRDAPDRQRTLAATIAWSYSLLTEEEQRVFGALSVFADGATLDAVETVCGGGTEILASLLDKSLLRRRGDRYGMLVTIRAFAQEQRQRSDPHGAIADRHADYYLALGQAGDVAIAGGDVAWLARLEAETANMRTAEVRLYVVSDDVGALALAVGLGRFRLTHGHVRESRGSLERALLAAPRAPKALRAHGLRLLAQILVVQGDAATALTLAAESVSLFEAIGDEYGAAVASSYHANAAVGLGAYEDARTWTTRSADLFQRLGRNRELVGCLATAAYIALALREPEAESLALKAAVAAREASAEESVATSLVNAANAAVVAGNPRHAHAYLKEAGALAVRIGHRYLLSYCAEAWGAVAAREARPELAARLLGAAEADRRTMALALDPVEAELHEETVAAIKQALPQAALAAAWEAGAELEIAAGLTLAETVLDQSMT